MMSIVALLLAAWFRRELARFPDKINQQIFQDYQALYETPLTVEDFKAKSALQHRPSKLGYGFFLLFPLLVFAFHEKGLSLVLIMFLLGYLAVVDMLYYLTDIDYVAAMFLLAISQLIFSDSAAVQMHLMTFLASALFFAALNGLLRYLSPKTMLGSGDILLLLALSPLFLLEEMLKLLLYASLSGIAFYLFYRIVCGVKQERLPFIPFIMLGVIFTL